MDSYGSLLWEIITFRICYEQYFSTTAYNSKHVMHKVIKKALIYLISTKSKRSGVTSSSAEKWLKTYTRRKIVNGKAKTRFVMETDVKSYFLLKMIIFKNKVAGNIKWTAKMENTIYRTNVD